MKHYLSIERTEYTIDNSERFYTVSIRVGTGNCWCQFFKKMGVPIRLVVSGKLRWMLSGEPDSIGFGSFLYPVVPGRRVFKDEPYFYLIPNTTIELAVAKTPVLESKVYALGGYMENLHIIGTYDLNLDLFTVGGQQLSRLTIYEYIKDGKVVID